MEKITFERNELPINRVGGVSVSIPESRDIVYISAKVTKMLDIKDRDLIEFEVWGDSLYVRKTQSKEVGYVATVVPPRGTNRSRVTKIVNKHLVIAIAKALGIQEDRACKLGYTGVIRDGFYIFSK